MSAHMGFELEMAHSRIVAVLTRGAQTQDEVIEVVSHLQPKKLRMAVAETLGLPEAEEFRWA